MKNSGTRTYTFHRRDDSEILVTVKPHAVNLFIQPQNNLWTFDLEGRIVGMYVDGVNYRRTLSNHYYQKDRISIDGEDYRNVTPIGLGLAENLLDRAHDLFREIKSQIPSEIHILVQKILSAEMDQLEKDGQQFSRIYLPISILPPDQYMALVVQITEGCNYNRCTFCNFYRDRPFKIKTRDEVDIHLNQMMEFFGKGIRLRKSVFLADANALVTPQDRLTDFIHRIHDKTGQQWKIFSFIDVFTGLKKSAEDFSQLASLGLTRVYLGIESGDQELLEFLHKPQVTDDIIDLAENLKAGGVQLGLIFLTGAGGEPFHHQHLESSVSLMEKIPVGKGDIIYLSEFYETNPEYESELQKRGILPPNRQEIRKMTLEFQERFRKFTGRGAMVSPYDIQQFLY